MSKKFANKIMAERKILSVVNEFTKHDIQLTGITAYAISAWATKINPNQNLEIIELLYKLSNLCHRLSDRSQESYESLDEEVTEKIEKIIPELRQALVLLWPNSHQ
ncbi:MAG TPA: hypothetical protein VLC91_16430 [Spongiibacteraceae bacterium]|nr:hypothetical protein [Spongiibacteraceae bacterium]